MTVIYPSPIFGPVHSRRLGVSLGINLLPADGKCCSFDCIYCECGFNHDFVPKQKMPTREEVRQALENQLIKMKDEGTAPDVLTFAGNGEPTLHPHFPEIIDDTQILRQPVFDALCKVDNNICKIDTIDPDYIALTDRPNGNYDVLKIIEGLKRFGNRCVIQTMFMKGEHEGKSVDNTSEAFVQPWLQTIQAIQPREVMIYTIDRETPAHQLKKASPEELDAIGEQVRKLGLACSVAY